MKKASTLYLIGQKGNILVFGASIKKDSRLMWISTPSARLRGGGLDGGEAAASECPLFLCPDRRPGVPAKQRPSPSAAASIDQWLTNWA